MIHVNSDRVNLEMIVDGHAGAERNSEGHDLVCCAASILAQTLIYYAQQCGQLSVEGHVETGNVHFRITPEREYMDVARIAYDVIEKGMAMLEEAYPQHISIRYGAIAHPSDTVK